MSSHRAWRKRAKVQHVERVEDTEVIRLSDALFAVDVS